MLINHLMLFCCSSEKQAQEMKSVWKWRKNEWQKVKAGRFEKKWCLFCCLFPLSTSLSPPEWLSLASAFSCAGNHISFFARWFRFNNASLNCHIKAERSKSFVWQRQVNKEIISSPNAPSCSTGKFLCFGFLLNEREGQTITWVRQGKYLPSFGSIFYCCFVHVLEHYLVHTPRGWTVKASSCAYNCCSHFHFCVCVVKDNI